MAQRGDGLNDIYDENLTIRKQIFLNKGTISTTPSADLDVVNKKYVDDAISGVAPGSSSNYSKLPINQIEFLNAAAGSAGRVYCWNAAAIGGSSQATVTTTSVNHPGVVSFSSRAGTANSGYYYLTDLTSIKLGSSGAKATFIFQIITEANTVTRLGFMDVATSAAVTNGVYLNINGLVVTGETIDALGGASTTGTNYTLIASRWYRGVIDMTDSDLSGTVTFSIYAEGSTTALWSSTLSSNIPSTATGHGCLSYSSSTTAVVLIYMDYMDFVCSRTLTR